MKFILATKNAHKVKEFERILSPLGISVVSQAEAGVDVDVVEDADTFEGNSLKKARAVFEATGMPALADDSGLQVFTLDMRPGIFSARYGGPGLTDAQRTEKLLSELENVADEARGAQFVACISLVLDADKHYCFTDVCEGKIGHAPKGENGFGYDPVFLVGERSFSELSPAEKDAVSHRGKALRQLAAALPGILKGESEPC